VELVVGAVVGDGGGGGNESQQAQLQRGRHDAALECGVLWIYGLKAGSRNMDRKSELQLRAQKSMCGVFGADVPTRACAVEKRVGV
jgi:hypothetical protein